MYGAAEFGRKYIFTWDILDTNRQKGGDKKSCFVKKSGLCNKMIF